MLQAPLIEVVKGETGYALNAGTKIWYEKIPSALPAKGTVLLIMGNGQDALSWPPGFIANFTDKGYEVIRYDHRGTGLSEYGKKWKKKDPYTLTDMANDAIAILDVQKIQKAHIVGVSMGGMIAQIIALNQPQRTLSLTSIMSSGDILDPELPPMSNEVLPKMVSAIFKHGFFGSKKGQIKRQIVQKRILMDKATGDIDVNTLAKVALYNLKKRKGYNLMSARHHFAAMLTSKSRLEAFKTFQLPTLIIHGVQDPVIPIAHGKKLAKTIPNSTNLWIDNMGHDLPDWALEKMTDAIVENFEDAND
ncbi:MAG: alpha/beta hydrolase [Flavobacteriaceae bacterium]